MICCGCITVNCTRMHTTKNNTGRKLHALRLDIGFYLVIVWVVKIDLISVWGIGIDSFLCGRRKCLRLDPGSIFLCASGTIEIDLFWQCALELTWHQCWCPKSLGFCMEGPNRLGFIVATKLDLFFVRGSKLSSFVCGPKMTFFRVGIHWPGFCVGGQNWLAFSVGDGAWLVFSVGVELIWCLCGWSKLTWCKFKDRNWLDFLWRSNVTFYGVWIGINSISVSWHRNPLNIREGIAIGFISVMESREICFFVCGILMDLVLAGESKLLSFFVQWSNLTSFLCGTKNWWLLCMHRKWSGFCVRADYDLFLVWTWCLCEWSNWLDFSAGNQNWLWVQFILLSFCVAVEDDLFLTPGS